jgi:ribonuclease P protein component
MPAAREFGFPRRLHLRERGCFERLFQEGRRVGDHRLTIWGLPNGLSYSRLGVVVGRKHGGAVQRSRLKRMIREAFRLSRPQLPPGLDLVCVPRVGTEIELGATIKSLLRLTTRLSRHLGAAVLRANRPSAKRTGGS